MAWVSGSIGWLKSRPMTSTPVRSVSGVMVKDAIGKPSAHRVTLEPDAGEGQDSSGRVGRWMKSPAAVQKRKARAFCDQIERHGPYVERQVRRLSLATHALAVPKDVDARDKPAHGRDSCDQREFSFA